MKVVFLTSHPMSVLAFLLPHLKALKPILTLNVFANTHEVDLLSKHGFDLPVEFAPVERSIRPISDLRALWWLFRKFRAIRPNAVHTLTPKAGLLGLFAAWVARVPVRVHTFTGQVWVTRKGPMRWVLKLADKCIAALATDVLVDSPSQRNFLIREGVLKTGYSSVLGAGSISGVDVERFHPSKEVRQKVRKEMGTPNDALVCLYLGRLNRDKGVLDLATAFSQVAIRYPQVELWVVGPDEDDIFAQMHNLLGCCIQQVKRVGYTNEPERFMQAADLFCLPSYREGFGSSVIEAAACGVPTLATRIYGLTDAVVEGKTGWMYEVGNVQELSFQLNALFQDPAKIKNIGRYARINAVQYFEQGLITAEMVSFYLKFKNV